jgi:hypothetical protein
MADDVTGGHARIRGQGAEVGHAVERLAGPMGGQFDWFDTFRATRELQGHMQHHAGWRDCGLECISQDPACAADREAALAEGRACYRQKADSQGSGASHEELDGDGAQIVGD